MTESTHQRTAATDESMAGALRVEVVNTGTELLLGQVVNTHVGYFGDRLFRLGIRIARQVAVPDGSAIGVAMAESFARADVVLVTGGLGPTDDDISRESIAALLGLPLRFDADVMRAIGERFRRIGREPGANNRRQAMVPAGARVLANPNGTAPGLYLPAGVAPGTPDVFLLPGPPRELHPMFEADVLPVLAALRAPTANPTGWRNYLFFGVGESDLATRADPALAAIVGLEVGYCLKDAGVIVRCIGGAEALAAADRALVGVAPEDLVSTDDRTLEQVVVALLAARGESLATAESCTGGYLAHLLTNVPGSSAVFGFGHVTYADAAKSALLAVPAGLLAAHGAVSAEVAERMADGCLRAAAADHALSITGIAGPDGGTEAKPVGTVHIGLASRGLPTRAFARRLQCDRLTFKERTARLALDLLRRRLRGYL